MKTVTLGPWNYSGCFGSGVNGYRIEPFRIRDKKEWTDRGLKFTGQVHCKVQRGQIYGLTIPLQNNRQESARIGLLYGYIQPYGRNLTKFVMSRAARKRGYKTNDFLYNHRHVLPA